LIRGFVMLRRDSLYCLQQRRLATADDAFNASPILRPLVEETTVKHLRRASANSSDVKGGVLPAECAAPHTSRGRFARAHDFNPDRNIAATFQTLPGTCFVVNGAAQAHDAALTAASAEIKWLNAFSLAATFEGEFSGVTSSYAGKGVVRYTW
jgi:hypothetical protein